MTKVSDLPSAEKLKHIVGDMNHFVAFHGGDEARHLMTVDDVSAVVSSMTFMGTKLSQIAPVALELAGEVNRNAASGLITRKAIDLAAQLQRLIV